MWYIYMENTKDGRQTFTSCFIKKEDAIKRIAQMYKEDVANKIDGRYYYFMKEQ